MNSKCRMTETCLAAGQGRAYADTVHTYRVLFEWQGIEGYTNQDAPFVPRDLREDVVKKYCRAVYEWKEKDDPAADWSSPFLKYLKKTGTGEWEFSVVEAFTD